MTTTHTISHDPPVFEVICPGDKQRFAIWADGRIEGFPDFQEGRIVINRIPSEINRAVAKALKVSA